MNWDEYTINIYMKNGQVFNLKTGNPPRYHDDTIQDALDRSFADKKTLIFSVQASTSEGYRHICLIKSEIAAIETIQQPHLDEKVKDGL